jgi:protein-S-isoprenylcysteine O-methyltransferase Ste14
MDDMPIAWGHAITPQYATIVVWLVWFVSWMLAALWSARVAKRVDWNSQFLYRLVTIAGAYLLFGVMTHSYRGPGRLWLLSDEASWALVGVVALGFLFAWWARIYLGSLWSGWITKKADHHIVDTGPYALVRHPIYTGLIVSAFATAIQRGTILALLGAAVMAWGFWIKARLEERFLREELGPEAYDSYRRRVPMLIPFGRKAA